MDIFFIFAAKYLLLLPIAILGIYFLIQPWSVQKKILVFALPSLILIYLVALLGGYLYYDPRPFVVGSFTPLIPHTPDNGFPSDHTLLVSAVASIGFYLNRRFGVVLWALAIVVAVTRVYVGLHHPTDVIGSIIISAAATSIVYLLITYVWHKEII